MERLISWLFKRLLILISLMLIFNTCTDGTETAGKEDEVLDITVFILNQRHQLHEEKAINLARTLMNKAEKLPQMSVTAIVGSMSLRHLPYSTFFPLLSELEYFEKRRRSDWYVVVDEFVSIDLGNLLTLLTNKSSSWFIGRALSDSGPSMIHHYARPSDVPRYPDTRAGFILAGAAIRHAASKYDEKEYAHDHQFSIDPAYEFAKWLLNVAAIELEDSTAFCIATPDVLDDGSGDTKHCAVVAHPPYVCQPDDTATPYSIGLHVAVKTHSGNHKTRLPVLRETWLPQATSYTLYSDVTDVSEDVVWSRVNNTERGHCAKTLSIMQLSLQDPRPWHWLLIVDDDTLVSLPRLSSLLSCYSSGDPIAAGEVYGYRGSYYGLLPYPTGGSGMLFSRPMVRDITSSRKCRCNAADEPDDMMLGMCIYSGLDHPLLHFRDMHQATPGSYSAGRLYGSLALSFHSFWLIDPVLEYDRWLHQAPHHATLHQEL
uniref:N-acetylgalactosaminide beta-1,3-galactosyltransferase n=1 Tax=Hirondellea gigas TaxID=1518452 RepID=A0A2P2HZ08_9CRUS